MSDWYPEGGFYETRAKQGESPWEDAAQFDPPIPATEDMRSGEQGQQTAVSWGDLTQADSYAQGPSQTYGAGPQA